SAKNRGLVVICQTRRRQDVVDGSCRPWVRKVCTQHHLTDSGHSDKVAKRFARKNQRVKIHLFQIIGRSLLQCVVALLRKRQAPMIGSISVGREVSSAMCRTNLQSWKTIERPLENQMGKRNRRAERISDHIRQHAIAAQSRLEFRYTLRVKKDWDSQFFSLCPKWIEARGRQFFSADHVSDRTSMQSELPHTFFQLFGRKVGMLQCDRRQSCKTVGMLTAEFCQSFILHCDQPSRDVAISCVPKRIDAEDFDVDTLFVHLPQPI